MVWCTILQAKTRLARHFVTSKLKVRVWPVNWHLQPVLTTCYMIFTNGSTNSILVLLQYPRQLTAQLQTVVCQSTLTQDAGAGSLQFSTKGCADRAGLLQLSERWRPLRIGHTVQIQNTHKSMISLKLEACQFRRYLGLRVTKLTIFWVPVLPANQLWVVVSEARSRTLLIGGLCLQTLTMCRL